MRNRSGELTHRAFHELPDILTSGTVLIINDSRVIPARVTGKMSDGKPFELLLLEPAAGKSPGAAWRAIGKPARKFYEGLTLSLGDQDDQLEVVFGPVTHGGSEGPLPFTVTFDRDEAVLTTWLDRHGYIPLPPYIARPKANPAAASSDRDRYQTVYADRRGSVAAPTAGLHFTAALMERLQAHGIEIAPITLHVGGGTFLPVKCQDPRQHVMHAERYRVPAATLAAIKAAHLEGRPILAVGTTSFRCLQAFWQEGQRTDEWCTTDIFIRPETRDDRYQPAVVQGLITNFHQPGSTLFMLISALLGLDEAKSLYATALSGGYRFLSYGDACLFWL